MGETQDFVSSVKQVLCPVCAHELTELIQDAVLVDYCPKCGEDLRRLQWRCRCGRLWDISGGSEADTHWIHLGCGHCGRPLAGLLKNPSPEQLDSCYCPACGRDLWPAIEDGDAPNFCPDCGESLSAKYWTCRCLRAWWVGKEGQSPRLDGRSCFTCGSPLADLRRPA